MPKTTLDNYNGLWVLEDTSDTQLYENTLLTKDKLLTGNVAMSITYKNGSASIPATTVTANTINVSGTTATLQITITPSYSVGWISSGNSGIITMSATIPIQTKTVTPTTNTQEVVPDSSKLLEQVVVNSIPLTYAVVSGTKDITSVNTNIDVRTFASISVPAMQISTISSASSFIWTVTPSSSDKYLQIYEGFMNTSYIRVHKTSGNGSCVLNNPSYDIKNKTMTNSVNSFSAGLIMSAPSNKTIQLPYLSGNSIGQSYSGSGCSLSGKFFYKIICYKSGSYTFTFQPGPSSSKKVCIGVIMGDVKVRFARNDGDHEWYNNSDWYSTSGNAKTYKFWRKDTYQVGGCANGSTAESSFITNVDQTIKCTISEYGSGYYGLIAMWYE